MTEKLFNLTMNSLCNLMMQNMIQDIIIDELYNIGILKNIFYQNVMLINDVNFCKQSDELICKYIELSKTKTIKT